MSSKIESSLVTLPVCLEKNVRRKKRASVVRIACKTNVSAYLQLIRPKVEILLKSKKESWNHTATVSEVIKVKLAVILKKFINLRVFKSLFVKSLYIVSFPFSRF